MQNKCENKVSVHSPYFKKDFINTFIVATFVVLSKR